MNSFVKLILGVVVIIGLGLGVYQLWEYWGKFKPSESDSGRTQAAVIADSSDSSLPGLPPKLEPILEASRKRGAAGLHDFLLTYGRTVADPRLASIQLDYVVLVAKDDPSEARRVFASVKTRTSQTSPVYPRVQLLARTYE